MVAGNGELDKALATRLYDDLFGSFTKGGYVDEQTQKTPAPSSRRSPRRRMWAAAARRCLQLRPRAERPFDKQGWKPQYEEME